MDGWMDDILSHWYKDVVTSWLVISGNFRPRPETAGSPGQKNGWAMGMEKDGTLNKNCLCAVLFCELNEWNKHKQLKHVETVGYTHLFLVVENGANVEGIKKHRFHWVVGFTFQNDDHSGKACGVGYKQHCTTHPTKSSVVIHFTRPQWPTQKAQS